MLCRLPPSLAGEVALVIRADIVESVHVFRFLSPQRIARALRPQVPPSHPLLSLSLSLTPSLQLLQPDTTIYSRGDLGEEMYFILSGSVKKFIDDSAKVEVSRVMYIEKNKHAYLRGSYYKGCHFGEMCLISQHARREATAVAETECQVYSLHKRSLWEIFQYMTRQDQRVFLIHLYTEVNGYCHTLFDEENINMKLIARTLTSTIDNLYNLADSVMNEIMDEGIRAGKIPESIKLVNDTFIKKQPGATQSPVVGLLSCPWFEVLQVYEQKKVEVMSHTHSHASSHGLNSHTAAATVAAGSEGAGEREGAETGQPSTHRVSRAVNFSQYVSQQGGAGEEGGPTPSDPNEIFYQRYSRRASRKPAAAPELSPFGSGKNNGGGGEEQAAVDAEDLSGASVSSQATTSATAAAAPMRPSIDEMLRLRIMDLFQFMDSDDTGEVSREQILESLKALGWEGVTGDVLDKMIQDADRTGSGKDRVDCDGIVDVILAAMGDVGPSPRPSRSPSKYSSSAVVPLPLEIDSSEGGGC
jgi:CRP-like cAMP-binding protein